jgi:hypothetical protein
MQTLIISSDKDSRPQIAITALLASIKMKETSIAPTALPLFGLDDADCAIYIDPQADFKIVDQLQQCRCPSILVADQDFQDSRCLFIPFGILDQSLSVSIGITLIQDFLNSISSELNDGVDESTDLVTRQRAPTIAQIRQAREDFDFFEYYSAAG